MKFGRRVRWRLERHITKDPSGCWLWTGFITPDGYGRISIKRRDWAAHRAVWYLIRGEEIPDDLVAHHTCGVKHCVNPDHLEPMTPRRHRFRHMTDESLASQVRRLT